MPQGSGRPCVPQRSRSSPAATGALGPSSESLIRVKVFVWKRERRQSGEAKGNYKNIEAALKVEDLKELACSLGREANELLVPEGSPELLFGGAWTGEE